MILCVVIEASTFALTTVWAAISSLIMIFLSLTKMPFKWQILIFLLITILLVLFTRPFAIKKLKIGKNATNVNSIVGQEVLVVKEITQFNKGEVKAKNGVIWSATSDNDAISENAISENEICVVVEVDGNTLKVQKKQKS